MRPHRGQIQIHTIVIFDFTCPHLVAILSQNRGKSRISTGRDSIYASQMCYTHVNAWSNPAEGVGLHEENVSACTGLCGASLPAYFVLASTANSRLYYRHGHG